MSPLLGVPSVTVPSVSVPSVRVPASSCSHVTMPSAACLPQLLLSDEVLANVARFGRAKGIIRLGCESSSLHRSTTQRSCVKSHRGRDCPCLSVKPKHRRATQWYDHAESRWLSKRAVHAGCLPAALRGTCSSPSTVQLVLYIHYNALTDLPVPMHGVPFLVANAHPEPGARSTLTTSHNEQKRRTPPEVSAPASSPSASPLCVT